MFKQANYLINQLGLTSDSIAFLAAAVAAVVAVGGAFAFLLKSVGSWIQARRERSNGVVRPARLGIFLRDQDFVTAYNRKFRDYIDITVDEDIATALGEWNGFLLVGRGGIGKSQAACEHIRRFCRQQGFRLWHVIVPDRQNLVPVARKGWFRNRVILFFDDINEYLQHADSAKFFAFVEHYRLTSKEFKIVGTCRSSDREYSALDLVTKLIGRIREVNLPDWSEEQRKALAAQTGTDKASWDGTPLSAKQPSQEMALKYRSLQRTGKSVLQCMRFLEDSGLSYCTSSLLCDCLKSLNPERDVVRDIEEVTGLGFFKRSGMIYEVYRPYLDCVLEYDVKAISEVVLPALLKPGRRTEFLRVARVLSDGRDIVGASAFIRSYLANHPQDGAAHYRLGFVAGRAQDWDQAQASFETAARFDFDHPSTWKHLAYVYRRQNNHDQAAKAIATAAKINRKRPPTTLIAQAIQELAERDLDSALRTVDIALEVDPWVLKGWGLKGQILLRQKRDSDAEEALREAELRSPDAFVQFGLAQIARGRKQWPEAIAFLNTAIGRDPFLGQAYSLLGQCQQQSKDSPGAVLSYLRAIELGVGAPAHFGLGLTYKSMSDWVSMSAQFTEAVRLEPENAKAWSFLGDGLVRTNKYEDAIGAYDRSVALNSNSLHLKLAYANGLGWMGKISQAVAMLENILQVDQSFVAARKSLEFWHDNSRGAVGH